MEVVLGILAIFALFVVMGLVIGWMCGSDAGFFEFWCCGKLVEAIFTVIIAIIQGVTGGDS